MRGFWRTDFKGMFFLAEKCASVPCVTASVDDLQIDKAIL